MSSRKSRAIKNKVKREDRRTVKAALRAGNYVDVIALSTKHNWPITYRKV